MTIYVDTGAWIALHEPRDRHHAAAKRFLDRCLADRTRLVTGWHTIIELVDGLTHHYDQDTAVDRLTRLTASRSVTILPSEPLREEALDLFTRHRGWEVDLSDCFSFALMEAEGIDTAFAFDADFEKPGFQVLP